MVKKQYMKRRERDRERHTDRQIDTERDGQTDRDRGRQTDRENNRTAWGTFHLGRQFFPLHCMFKEKRFLCRIPLFNSG